MSGDSPASPPTPNAETARWEALGVLASRQERLENVTHELIDVNADLGTGTEAEHSLSVAITNLETAALWLERARRKLAERPFTTVDEERIEGP